MLIFGTFSILRGIRVPRIIQIRYTAYKTGMYSSPIHRDIYGVYVAPSDDVYTVYSDIRRLSEVQCTLCKLNKYTNIHGNVLDNVTN